MIYLVTLERRLFDSEYYKIISVEESLKLLNELNILSVDTETDGRDARINKLLCVQIGNKEQQHVIDCNTINIRLYKKLLESKYCIFQNAKFDIQFFYSLEIIIRKVYDTMIVEQLLHLGYPSGVISYSLAAIAERRLGKYIDKTVRGEIIWRGLDTKVIIYAANDIVDLEDIMNSQLEDCKRQEILIGAKLECDAVPGIAYCEWCGIKLDENKWKEKMIQDQIHLAESKKALDDWLISYFNTNNSNLSVKTSTLRTVIGYTPYCDKEYSKYLKDKKILEESGYVLIKSNTDISNMGSYSFVYEKRDVQSKELCINLYKKYVVINRQGDLFTGFDLTPKCRVNWSSSRQVVEVAKALGFNTVVQDKKTGEYKDSVLEKTLKTQKGINDEFLKLYFDYQEHAKVVSTYGQAQLNMINPITGRCHTVYKQLGASSGRMSCGSQQPNTDLAKLKKISPKECTYCNFQQLPADDVTRSAFVAEEGNVLCDCDYSALESYLGADIYNDKEFQNEFLYGSGDTHSLFAWMVFRKECEALGCTSVKDVKKKAPQWRKAVKAVEFAYMFGAAAPTISQSANCSVEQAQKYIDRLDEGFKGISNYAKQGSKFVREHGYVLMNKYTGHKMYWWDHNKWLERQKSFTQEFWEEYRTKHKGTGDEIAQEVRQHFQAASKWDRMARNAPTQGSGSNIIKLATTKFFDYIVDNKLFNIVKICAIVHDELLVEYPETMPEICHILEDKMKEASRAFCKFTTIPAVGEVAKHWVH